MSRYCPHLVPLTHSCQNCNDDKPFFDARIKSLEAQLKYKEGMNKSLEHMVLEQDKKIFELATKLEYANRTIELAKEPKQKEYYDEDTFDVQYLYMYKHEIEGRFSMSHKLDEPYKGWVYMGKVRVEK
jgi:uncharacterized coiled-coil protein SlyX